MGKVEDPVIPVCPVCKRKTIYFRADGTIKCRACGYDGPNKVRE